jgi:hypothetical protein
LALRIIKANMPISFTRGVSVSRLAGRPEPNRIVGQAISLKSACWEETELSTLRWPLAGLLLAIATNVAGAQPAQADPLIPLTPTELQYLQQVRTVLTASHNDTAFRSDGELLVDGRYACQQRASGFVGQEATLLPSAVTQLAFIYLCPN